MIRLHILKPVEFLVELLKIDRQNNEVNDLLNEVAQHSNSFADVALADSLTRSFITVDKHAVIDNTPSLVAAPVVPSAIH